MHPCSQRLERKLICETFIYIKFEKWKLNCFYFLKKEKSKRKKILNALSYLILTLGNQIEILKRILKLIGKRNIITKKKKKSMINERNEMREQI